MKITFATDNRRIQSFDMTVAHAEELMVDYRNTIRRQHGNDARRVAYAYLRYIRFATGLTKQTEESSGIYSRHISDIEKMLRNPNLEVYIENFNSEQY